MRGEFVDYHMPSPPEHDKALYTIQLVLMVVFGILTLVAAGAFVLFSLRQRPLSPIALMAAAVGLWFGFMFSRLWTRFKERRNGYIDEEGKYVPPWK